MHWTFLLRHYFVILTKIW